MIQQQQQQRSIRNNTFRALFPAELIFSELYPTLRTLIYISWKLKRNFLVLHPKEFWGTKSLFFYKNSDFRLTLLQIAMIHVPKKLPASKKTNPFTHSRNILRRGKKKVRSQINAMSSESTDPGPTSKLFKLCLELYNINEKIQNSVHDQQKMQKSKAVKNIKENPKFFYSYAKRHNKHQSTVGPFYKQSGELTDDPKTTAIC